MDIDNDNALYIDMRNLTLEKLKLILNDMDEIRLKHDISMTITASYNVKIPNKER